MASNQFQAQTISPSQQSRQPSIFSAASIDTLVASNGYRGYASQDDYLKALQEWADSKRYFENDVQLKGFYGDKTSEYYKNKPGLRSGRKERRATAAQLSRVEEDESTPVIEESKTSKLKKVFSRRGTIA